ncbi:AEC family transporter [Leucothrix sargassi]|nr:AEC family transporter [Leucothrix sargassi]
MLDNLFFAFEVTAPTFLVICLGIYLKRAGLITNEFADIGAKLVFQVTLPCLLFTKLVQANFNVLPVTLIVYALSATLLVFLILEFVIAPRLVAHDRSAFVQGSFRSNMGIVGLAFCLDAFGDDVLKIASVYLAFLTILFNILSLTTLARHQGVETSPRQITITIIKNPLIVSIVVAIILSQIQFSPPKYVMSTLGYVGGMSMPLALICTGASIRWRDFQTSNNLYWTSIAKLIIVPVVITAGGILIGLRGEMLGVLFLMSSAPAASAGYPMLRAAGGNYHLGAAIIATTSIAAIIPITLGLFILRGFQLI